MAIVLGNSHMFLTEIKSVNLLLVFSNCHAVYFVADENYYFLILYFQCHILKGKLDYLRNNLSDVFKK